MSFGSKDKSSRSMENALLVLVSVIFWKLLDWISPNFQHWCTLGQIWTLQFWGSKGQMSQHDQGPSRWRHTELDAVCRVLISGFCYTLSIEAKLPGCLWSMQAFFSVEDLIQSVFVACNNIWFVLFCVKHWGRNLQNRRRSKNWANILWWLMHWWENLLQLYIYYSLDKTVCHAIIHV